MKVDDQLVDHIAHLARLEFNSEEKVQIKKDMTRILDFIDQLNEFNTDGVEPLIYMSEETNVMREDVAQVSISQKEALSNAPIKDSDFIKVPTVLGKPTS